VEDFYPLKLANQADLARTDAYDIHHVCVVGGGLAGLSAAW
jgi:hypothetical protein